MEYEQQKKTSVFLRTRQKGTSIHVNIVNVLAWLYIWYKVANIKVYMWCKLLYDGSYEVILGEQLYCTGFLSSSISSLLYLIFLFFRILLSLSFYTLWL